METLAVRKWPRAIMEDKKERDFCMNKEEEGGVHILTFCFIITDGFSIGKMELMKLIVSLIFHRWKIR